MIRNIVVHYGGILAAVFFAAVLWFSCFDILQVQENSMEPGLRHGQTILVSKLAYKFFNAALPSAEDIIVFNNPDDNSLVVKRCRLLPGDPININSEGWLIVEDQKYFLTLRQRQYLEGIHEVPEESVLVLGDNPFHSVDSRDYGCVSIESIRGKVINPFRGILKW